MTDWTAGYVADIGYTFGYYQELNPLRVKLAFASAGRFAQLFLLAISQGKKQPVDWAQATWQVLAAQGQKILNEGKTLATSKENLAELTLQTQSFTAPFHAQLK